MFKSSNPAFANDAFRNFEPAWSGTTTRPMTMTVQGTISKTFLCLAILSATAIWSWNSMSAGQMSMGVIGVASIAGFILGLVTSFKPNIASWTAPIYSALQGVVLGTISLLVESRTRPGIAIEAVALSSGVLLVMLGLYATRLIRVTEKLRTGVMAALGALMLYYLVSMVLQLFHVSVTLPHQMGKFGIIFALLVVGLAAFCLLLDFDMIEQGARYGAPRSLEWYGAFALMVSLIWLYWQVLNLLMRLYSDRR
jgi:uncharacterized YccA/Bax inhibitor family protein